MTALPIYQVDAFTNKTFGGNPAAVVPLDAWLPDDVMQSIAIENNYSETAFFIPNEDGSFHLRWFTPTYEIDLCGHATLATSFVILNELYPNLSEVRYTTNESGELIVTKTGNLLTMDFPNRPANELNVSDIIPDVIKGIGSIAPEKAYIRAKRLFLIFKDQKTIQSIDPDFRLLKNYPSSVCVTAPADDQNLDFVSRFFCAYDDTIPEDPVTGSAHTTLTPYWAKRLNKNELKARQISKRGGNLGLRLENDRVYISGEAVLYLKGHIYV